MKQNLLFHKSKYSFSIFGWYSRAVSRYYIWALAWPLLWSSASQTRIPAWWQVEQRDLFESSYIVSFLATPLKYSTSVRTNPSSNVGRSLSSKDNNFCRIRRSRGSSCGSLCEKRIDFFNLMLLKYLPAFSFLTLPIVSQMEFPTDHSSYPIDGLYFSRGKEDSLGDHMNFKMRETEEKESIVDGGRRQSLREGRARGCVFQRRNRWRRSIPLSHCHFESLRNPQSFLQKSNPVYTAPVGVTTYFLVNGKWTKTCSTTKTNESLQHDEPAMDWSLGIWCKVISFIFLRMSIGAIT